MRTSMTTRFKEDEPLDSLFSSIHETGHGLYEQGLPGAHPGTALAIQQRAGFDAQPTAALAATAAWSIPQRFSVRPVTSA